MSESEHIERTRRALHDLEEELQDAIKGRDDLVEQVVLALSSSEHVMIRGKHGEAKSMLAEKLAEATDLSAFTQQIHRETRTKHIAGMLDLEKYEEDSELDLIETEFFSSHILHFDEFLRGTEEFQDLLLEVMEERRFTKSYKDSVELPVLSVIATTNPLTSGYNTGSIDEALMSRFAFVVDVDHLVEDSHRRDVKQAIEATEDDLSVEPVDLDPQDIRRFRDYAIENVDADSELISMFAHSLSESGMSIDTRFYRRFRQVVQTKHLLEGYHEPDDQMYLDTAVEMFSNRFDGLKTQIIEDAMDDAILRARFAEDIDELDDVSQIEDPLPFVENGMEKLQQIEEENDAIPDMLRRKMNELEERITEEAMRCLDDMSPGTVRQMSSEKFSTVRKQYLENHEVRSKMVEADCPDHEEVQDIMETYAPNAEVETTKSSGRFTAMKARPKLDSEDSFDEVVTVRKRLEDEGLLHKG